MSDLDLSILFFLQLALILGACRVCGVIGRKFGQPQVVCEMIAGVLLGPSVFGLLWPAGQAWMFPKESITILYAVSQVALSLYMFLIGMEFRTDLFRQKIRGAAAVSIAGMAAPFILGGALGWWLVGQEGLFSPTVKHFEGAIYLGASMCITAFPMLARILFERGLTGTSLGTLALAAGAMDDAAAWCLLAVVLASFGGSTQVAVMAIGGGILYAVLVALVGRPLLARLGPAAEKAGGVSGPLLGFILCLVMIASWITDILGIYAVFGAFILGTAMPRGTFVESIRKQVEPLVVVFLLPLFFTFSGLKTRLDLVTTPWLLGLAAVVLLAAILGKFGACWAAARLTGASQPTSLAIGALMNARGLMELIILNIGLKNGIIQPALFSVMVLMAIVTTLMATPLFEWVYGRKARAQGNLGESG